MHSFFFQELQLITVLLLVRNSYMIWSTWFISLKLCGVFYFRFCLAFVKLYISVQQNAWILWLKSIIIPFKIEIIGESHIMLLPDLWFLSWNKRFENSLISSWVGAPQILTRRRTYKIEVLSTSLFLSSNF